MLPMSDRTTGLLYVGVMVLLSFAFQYQMKILASEMAPALSRTTGLADKAHGLLRDLQVWRLLLVLTLAALLFAVWFLALTKLDLSLALPLASVALVVNTVGSGLLLGESLGFLRVGGVIVVAIGIAMVTQELERSSWAEAFRCCPACEGTFAIAVTRICGRATGRASRAGMSCHKPTGFPCWRRRSAR